jgi:hypothetical protein
VPGGEVSARIQHRFWFARQPEASPPVPHLPDRHHRRGCGGHCLPRRRRRIPRQRHQPGDHHGTDLHLVVANRMAGPDRPFLLASGVAALTQGRPAREDDASPFHGPESPRGGSENLALEFLDRGVYTVSPRFAPTVHGAGDHGFVAVIAAMAREKGVSGYPGRRDQPVGRRVPVRCRAPRRSWTRESSGGPATCTRSRKTAYPPATSRRLSAAPSGSRHIDRP